MAEENYKPFGAEWEKEIQKLPKPALSAMLARFGKEKAILHKMFIEAKSALNDVRNWDDDLEDAWGDPGLRAECALNKMEALFDQAVKADR